MKKVIAFIISVIILLSSVGAYSVEYTLPEKMMKQLEIGSGLKGSFSISTSGYGKDLPFLDALNKTEFEIRGLSTDGHLYYCIYQADDSEKQNNKTEIFSDNGCYYLKTELMNDQVYMVPDFYQIADTITIQEKETAAVTSAIIKLIEAISGSQSPEWETALKPYRERTELWLSRFPVVTDYTTSSDGRNCLEMSYDIPYTTMVSFIQELLPVLYKDETVLRLLGQIMTEEQKNLYLNPDLIYFYAEILNSFKTEEDIVISKTTDSKTGKTVAIHLSLPLNPEVTGFELFTADQEDNGINTWILRSENRMVSLKTPSNLIWDHDFEYEIQFMNLFYDNGKEMPDSTALRIQISRQSSGPLSSEEDEKSHENYAFRMKINQDPSIFTENHPIHLGSFDDIDAELNLHFSGKNAQQSPTTAELDFILQIGAKETSISGKFKSAAPWVVTIPETTDAINLLETTQDDQTKMINHLTEHMVELLRHIPVVSVPENENNPTPVPETGSSNASDQDTATNNIAEEEIK